MASGGKAPSSPAGRGGSHAESFHPTRLVIHPTAWVAPGSVLVGDVELAENVSVWYGCVLRGDLEPIGIGRGSNVQDLTVIHVDRSMPVRIGERVTIGHRCVIHGCVVEDEALIGMGAVLLSGCRIGRGALIAAGAVVREGFEVPPEAIASGVPAAIRGRVDDRLRARVREGVDTYIACAAGYREKKLGGGPYAGGPARGESESS